MGDKYFLIVGVGTEVVEHWRVLHVASVPLMEADHVNHVSTTVHVGHGTAFVTAVKPNAGNKGLSIPVELGWRRCPEWIH